MELIMYIFQKHLLSGKYNCPPFSVTQEDSHIGGFSILLISEKQILSQVWWYMPIIPGLWRQSRADFHEFKTSMLYTVCSRTGRATLYEPWTLSLQVHCVVINKIIEVNVPKLRKQSNTDTKVIQIREQIRSDSKLPVAQYNVNTTYTEEILKREH